MRLFTIDDFTIYCMLKIIVNAFALRYSGALAIYRQFISHLPEYVNGNQYYIFVDPSVEQPAIDGVTYIHIDNHSWKHRIMWELGGFTKWLYKNHIEPDVVVSLQNTGVITKYRQVIYYHQSLPFYSRKWSLFKTSERIMWLYKYVYPYFVKSTLSEQTEVVVQIPFIKRNFVARFHIEAKRVHVLFPDVEQININSIEASNLDMRYIHFLYPATPVPYKEHKTLIEALNVLKKRNSDIFDKIKIHFTLSNGDLVMIDNLIKRYGLEKQFIMEGRMSHDKLLSLYKASHGVLFPSTIETVGLPLLEGAAFGLPIIASDLDYAHEVLQGYSGVVFANPYNYNVWADEMEKVCFHLHKYQPLPYQESNWGKFFRLIEG